MCEAELSFQEVQGCLEMTRLNMFWVLSWVRQYWYVMKTNVSFDQTSELRLKRLQKSFKNHFPNIEDTFPLIFLK